MTTISIPSFNWASFYYGEILESLIQFKRINLPELTDESPQEPLIQLLRAFALVGHLNNTLADMVANESTLVTAQLPENIRNMLKLIDYDLSSVSPAEVDIVMKLTGALSASTVVVSANSKVATKAQVTGTTIYYEALTALTVAASETGDLTNVFAYDQSTDTYTDYTTEANSAPGDDFTPWSVPANRDCLYIGHSGVMWDQLDITLDTGSSGLVGLWEYYDGDYLDDNPDDVTLVGSTLRFAVDGILGTSERTGTSVRVQLDASGTYEDVISEWADYGEGNKNYITTTTLLGQQLADLDTDETHYTVGSAWKEISDVTDNTSNLSSSDTVEYTLPENLTESWETAEINGETNYWIRYRVISYTDGTAPIIDRIVIDQGDQYVKVSMIQGQTFTESNMGTSDGSADQEFSTVKTGFIDESETVTVDSVEWTRVDDFLQSTSVSKHYTVSLGEDDRATFTFGDGIRGKIPGSGSTIASVYRYDADADGNVGANTIVVDKSGLTDVSSVWNPRPAVGWQESQSASTESLELAKISGPASLRTKTVAISPDDIESMLLDYIDENTNSKIFIRGYAVEGGFGPKTVELVVVTAGGGVATSAQLSALDEYFNGDRYSSPVKPKRLVANQEITSTNYTQKVVNITATVYDALDVDAIEDSLTALLQPDTRKSDGVEFEWQFGEDVYLSRITHEIFASDSNITRVENLTINGFAANLELLSRELPVAGTIVITAG